MYLSECYHLQKECGVWSQFMKQGDTYVIFVDVYTNSILTVWCMSVIPVMHSDTQNAV